ncbi:hypothetical protein SAMN04488034_1094 [Salinimicrobium catena]|uniref:Uncharacterized protein n=1 Tax=Salinimicrobium catena TaxID=390640 RepID=A0A1H5P4U6_9FLAO|nr:DUF6090 family protein [Salinimicrobium catena]SDL72529.1 hypothetical protein SAMN04488140_10978 [Salinimicrobium catena]SEF08879.1 hypothetical protein SAMN04488034_1094 [Salinimicrobium catena]
MVNFFRKIRRKLLGKNRFRKYLLYAIGELVLLVAGILIALQINNANERRKAFEREQIYLKEFHRDLQLTQQELGRVIQKTARVSRKADSLIRFIVNPRPVADTTFADLTLSGFGFTVFMPSEGVIKDLVGSGQLALIRNDQLRSEIALWETNLEMIRQYEILFKDSYTDFYKVNEQYLDLTRILKNNTPYTTEMRKAFLEDVVLRNKLVRMYNTSQDLNDLYRQKRQDYDTLIKIVGLEIRD